MLLHFSACDGGRSASVPVYMNTRIHSYDAHGLIVAAWETLYDVDRLDDIAEHFADGYVRHSSDFMYTRDDLRDTMRESHIAFPDQTATIEDVIVDGDRVAYRWQSVGTHLGPYMGVPPTGDRMNSWGMTMGRIAHGKIVEEWSSWNEQTVLARLVGAPPYGV
jgi:steroid delta-isomerase-like uncharacterized protein